MSYVLLAVLAVILIVVLATVLSSIFTVAQQTVAIIERFGKFLRTANPGLHIKIPFVDQVVARPSLKVQPLDVKVETKTKDNVFVEVLVAVQYNVIPNKVYDAHYQLANHTNQITSYVFDVVRATVPNMDLDDVFVKKDEIASAVKAELDEIMEQYGYQVVKALVTDINPDSKVKNSMNDINAAQRERVAASERGEAEKILMVKKAEAEKLSKILQGEGVSGQRTAIVEGLRESIEQFQASIEGVTANDVTTLVLMTQYFDTLRDLGASSRTNTVLLPHSPGAVADMATQIRDSVITAHQVPSPESNA